MSDHVNCRSESGALRLCADCIDAGRMSGLKAALDIVKKQTDLWVWCDPYEPCPHATNCKELKAFSDSITNLILEMDVRY